MIELSIVKLILNKENFLRFNKILYTLKVEREVLKLINTVSNYYNDYQHHSYISLDELETYFYVQYPSEKNNEIYVEIFSRLRELQVSDSVAADLVRQYLEINCANKILEKIIPILDGKIVGSILEIPSIIDEFKETSVDVDEEESPFIEAGIEELSSLYTNVDGIRWPINCLNENIRPLVGGTLGHIFARPESGKTSLLANCVTHFAPQLPDDKSLLWCCNEEDGRRVKFRAQMSCLGMTQDEIRRAINAGKAEELTRQLHERGFHKIKFFYDTGLSYEQILEQMEKYNPAITVVDIADHVSFRSSQDYATHERIENLYRRFRSLASRFSCDIITVAQASDAASGRKVLHQEWMANSKTGKPGALDYIIGLGATYAEEDAETRWITICKNKIQPTITETSTVRFNKHIGRFEDM